MEGMVNTIEVDYLILGGGLSGIGAAHGLKKNNFILIEKSKRLLGHAKSFKFKDYYFDSGTHICHSIDKKWLDKLNLEDALYFDNSDVKNYDESNWIGYPVQNNLKDIDDSLKIKSYEEIDKNLKSKISANNYHEWSNQVYGETLTKKYYERFTNKYWRTPMQEMSLDWFNGRILPIKKKLVKEGMKRKPKNQAVFKAFRYPKNLGFENLFSNLIKDIKEKCKLNTEVISIDVKKKVAYIKCGLSIKYKKLINTLPLNVIVNLITSIPEEVKDTAKNLKYLNLITSAVLIKDFIGDKFPHWFYVYDEDIPIARITNISRITNTNNKDAAFQLETFRRNDEEYCIEKLIEKIQKDSYKIFNCEKKKCEFKHQYSEYSYVVSCLNTEDDRTMIINYLNSINVSTCGLYGLWKYMWSDASFWSGFETGELISNEKI